MNPETNSSSAPVATGVASVSFSGALVGLIVSYMKHHGIPVSAQDQIYAVIVLTTATHSAVQFLKPWMVGKLAAKTAPAPAKPN